MGMHNSKPAFIGVAPSAKTRTALPDFRLLCAALDGAEIGYTVSHVDNPAAPHDSFRPCLDVLFSPLTWPQFLLLHGIFSGWAVPSLRSRVRFAADRRYHLVDFLPPPFQALDQLVFVSQTQLAQEALPDLKQPGSGAAAQKGQLQNVGLYFNCFGYALTALRCAASTGGAAAAAAIPAVKSAPVRVSISAPDPGVTYASLADDRWSTVVADDFRSDRPHLSRDVRAGDYLLVYHELSNGQGAWLDHMAIIVCGNVLAEKAGSGDGTPFRLIDAASFERAWNPALGVFKRQVRRLRTGRPVVGGGATRPLCPQKDFSCHCELSVDTFGERLKRGVTEVKASRLGITHSLGNDGKVDGGVWTACLQTPPLLFDPVSGRASLPPSEFIKQ